MSFYDSSSASLGTCHECGGRVLDGGQSGAFCETPGCRYSWGGAQTGRISCAKPQDAAMLDALKRVKAEREANERRGT